MSMIKIYFIKGGYSVYTCIDDYTIVNNSHVVITKMNKEQIIIPFNNIKEVVIV